MAGGGGGGGGGGAGAGRGRCSSPKWSFKNARRRMTARLSCRHRDLKMLLLPKMRKRRRRRSHEYSSPAVSFACLPATDRNGDRRFAGSERCTKWGSVREIDTRAGRGHGHGTRSSKGRRIA